MSRWSRYFLLCSCWASLLVMSSCRSALYRAAEQGNAGLVRQELSEGALATGEPIWANALWQYPAKLLLAPVDVMLGICSLGLYDEAYLVNWVERFDKSPADIAWENGHGEVLAVLAEAGVAIAPESMSGRALLLQEEWYGGEGYTESELVLAEVGNENVADCFTRYWDEDDDWQRRRGMKLKHCMWRDAETMGQVLAHVPGKHSTAEMLETPDVLCYRRTGRRCAEVTERGLFPVVAGNKYELKFETQTSGSYRHLHADATGLVRQCTGRFWVRNIF